MLGSSLRMLRFRLGMDVPCRRTKQGGLSDFVSHTWQFLVSSLEHIIRHRSWQLLSFMTYTEGLQFCDRSCQLYSFMTYIEGLQFFTLGSSISPQIYTASEVHAFLFEIDPDIIPRVSHITSCEIDHEHHVVDFVSHTWQFLVSFLVHIIRDRSGNATDMIAGIYMYIPSFALPIYKTTCDAKRYLYRSVQYRFLSTVCV